MKIKINRKRFSSFISQMAVLLIGIITIGFIYGYAITEWNDMQNQKEYEKTQKNNINVATLPTPTEKPKPIYYDVPLSNELQDYIRNLCEQYDIDIKTVFAVMATESNFRQNVSSRNNSGGGRSIGIMQLNENYTYWHRDLTGIKNFDIHNIYHNIHGGIAVLNACREAWKEDAGSDISVYILNSYNCGVGGYKRYIRRTGRIHRAYDRKVFEFRNSIKVKELE